MPKQNLYKTSQVPKAASIFQPMIEDSARRMGITPEAYENMMAPLSPEDEYERGERDRKYQQEQKISSEQRRRGSYGAGPSKTKADLSSNYIKYR